MFLKRSKTILFLFSFLLTVSIVGFQSPAVAANEIQVFVDGQKVHFLDKNPVIEDGRVLVPLRAIQESFGSTIDWDQQTKKITSVKEKGQQQTNLTFYLDFPYVIQQYQNGNDNLLQMIEKIDVPPMLIQNRTMVPLRSATESMGFSVKWSQKNQTVTITANASIKPVANALQYEISGSGNLSEVEFEIFFLTNEERIKHGVQPLILDLDINKVARLKSQDMHDKQYFDHLSPTYGSPFDMLTEFGITYRGAGENIAAGYQNAKDVVTGWMNSEGHRKNILQTSYERIGIGYYYGSDGYQKYYTQMFITK